MSVQKPSGDHPPTIFRYDYPEAATDEWAVFWEVADEAEFAAHEGQIEDPTEFASEWIAISKCVVVDLTEYV